MSRNTKNCYASEILTLVANYEEYLVPACAMGVLDALAQLPQTNLPTGR